MCRGGRLPLRAIVSRLCRSSRRGLKCLHLHLCHLLLPVFHRAPVLRLPVPSMRAVIGVRHHQCHQNRRCRFFHRCLLHHLSTSRYTPPHIPLRRLLPLILRSRSLRHHHLSSLWLPCLHGTERRVQAVCLLLLLPPLRRAIGVVLPPQNRPWCVGLSS